MACKLLNNKTKPCFSIKPNPHSRLADPAGPHIWLVDPEGQPTQSLSQNLTNLTCLENTQGQMTKRSMIDVMKKVDLHRTETL
eukprot:c18862_g3_i1 orf=554-802(+)